MYYDCYIIALFSYVYTYLFTNILPIPDHFSNLSPMDIYYSFYYIYSFEFFFESEIKENGKELIEDLMKETHL